MNIETCNDKLKLLYDIGIVGFIVPDKIKSRMSLSHKYCFVFNAGVAPKEIADIPATYRECRIVFNPIFFRELDLVANTQDIINNFEWEYLMNQNHIHKDNIEWL